MDENVAQDAQAVDIKATLKATRKRLRAKSAQEQLRAARACHPSLVSRMTPTARDNVLRRWVAASDVG